MKKVLYVVLDGLGDRPVPQLGGRTPLEAAAVPFLGALTLDGQTGLVQTVGKGIAPESDVAVMAILGYDPFKYHTGRGVFEVVGLRHGVSRTGTSRCAATSRPARGARSSTAAPGATSPPRTRTRSRTR